MPGIPLHRPIGFAPSEISALVNEAVVSQHAEEAAFLWTVRERAIGEPQYALPDLARLDLRVEAHIDGLRIGGPTASDLCRTNLQTMPEGPGEVFAFAVLAFSKGDRSQMSEAVRIGCRSAGTSAALISALGWLEYDQASQWIGRLLEASAPVHRVVGIAASAIHRRDAGSSLAAAVDDPDPILRARASRMVGEIKRDDLLDRLTAHLEDDDDTCRFWSAWSLSLYRDDQAISVLAKWLDWDDAFSRRALQVVLRSVGLDAGRRLIASMAQRDDLLPLAVMGAGILGDPVSVPWLIRNMDSGSLARLAGEAFCTITGVDLTYSHLDGEPPPDVEPIDSTIEQVLDLGYESNLPWPSGQRVAQWWDEHGASYAAGVRYLGGRTITRESLIDLLVRGKQRIRAAAALELAILESTTPLFEVRARGDRQQRNLARWNS